MAEPFIGEIKMFSGNFAIRGWALCDGQLLAIAQTQALFALLGTTYGGNGIQTFALPDLRGRIPVGQGTGPGLTPRPIGQVGGTEQVTIGIVQMPQHTHTFSVTQDNASLAAVAATALPATPTAGKPTFYTVPGASPITQEALAPTVVGMSGASQPHNNIMPSLVINFLIALQGIFPSRN